MLVFSLGVVVLNTSASAAPNRPIFEVKISSHVAYITEEADITKGVETWVYVTNPSKAMERELEWPYTEIYHTVTVNSFTMTTYDDEGNPDWVTIYPDGMCCGNENGEIVWWECPAFEVRWDPVVYPMEKSLVFYTGWMWFGPDVVPGNVVFTYTLNVDFEGQTYDLVKTFTIRVTS